MYREDGMAEETIAWFAGVDWGSEKHFTTTDARIKLKRLYPAL